MGCATTRSPAVSARYTADHTVKTGNAALLTLPYNSISVACVSAQAKTQIHNCLLNQVSVQSSIQSFNSRFPVDAR